MVIHYLHIDQLLPQKVNMITIDKDCMKNFSKSLGEHLIKCA